MASVVCIVGLTYFCGVETQVEQADGSSVRAKYTVPYKAAIKPYPMDEEGLVALAKAHARGLTARAPMPGSQHE